jgi:multidrug efflux pump subunit AcrA (membrane-fusion protein)
MADDADLDDVDDPEAGDGSEPNAGAGQAVSRTRRRLQASIDTWQSRATLAEAELTSLRAQSAALQTQVSSSAQLRASLLQTVIRSQASSLVAPEALEDTVRLLDTRDIIVGDDGKVDTEKVKARVDEFVKARPHLAPRVGAGRLGSLPGGHMPSPNGGGGSHEEINDMLRRNLHGGGY